MSYNPYSQGPSAESGYGYGHGQGQPVSFSPNRAKLLEYQSARSGEREFGRLGIDRRLTCATRQEQHEMHSYGQQSYGAPQQQQYGQQHEQQYGQQYGQEQHYGSSQPQQQQQQQQYGSLQPQQGANVLSQTEFLKRVSAIRQDIQGLKTSIQNIATLHNQTLNSTDNSARQQLDDVVAATQLKNTSIRSQIQQLKADTERTTDGSFTLKKSQFESLNNHFKDTIQQFLEEERQYKEEYRHQIARQYKVVNPDATEAEVQQAVQSDWSDEGIFQQAVRFIFELSPPLPPLLC